MGWWRSFVNAVSKRASSIEAFNELERTCLNRNHVYVEEWCEKNPEQGDCIIGDCIGKNHRWANSQCVVTQGKGQPWEMKYNFFFKDLAMSISAIKDFVKRRKEEDARACGLIAMFGHLDDSSLAKIIVDGGGRKTVPDARSFIDAYRKAQSVGVV